MLPPNSAARRVGVKTYLSGPAAPTGIAVLLLLLEAYAAAGDVGSLRWPRIAALIAVGLVWLFRLPRGFGYALLCMLVVVMTYRLVLVDARGPHDSMADRDETVETAVRAYLAGEDPWAGKTPHGNSITSGHPSILIHAPVVALWGDAQPVAFVFWLLFLAALLAADVWRSNGRFGALALLYLLGPFAIRHTQLMALDELYYPILALAAAWVFTRTNQLGAAGACLGLTLLWRPSYALVGLGFVAWLALHVPWSWTRLGRLAIGGALACAATLACFVGVEGRGLSPHGPFSTAYAYAASPPDSSIVGSVAEGLRLGASTTVALKIAAAVGAIALAALGARKQQLDHPFWHVAAAGWVTHAVVWTPFDTQDYTLMIVLPGLLGLALGGPRVPTKSG